ncbi:thermosome subunit [Culex quinquefasciatus]|uniref:Thermosome subunit n=1 Tax=Culex quinquefasciatus TaxID=7176 RepID=B0XDS3_CULQU|nr:thermosome subunit [Culex quinquefasciatus]|eukprot:XP_001867795.1 thermosome subunit [Culex quinquefasciatus]
MSRFFDNERIKKTSGCFKKSFLDEAFLLDKEPGVHQSKRIENAKIFIANMPMDTDKFKRGLYHQVCTDRSLHDALCVLAATVKEVRIVYGGGCPKTLMACAVFKLTAERSEYLMRLMISDDDERNIIGGRRRTPKALKHWMRKK